MGMKYPSTVCIPHKQMAHARGFPRFTEAESRTLSYTEDILRGCCV